MRGSGGPALAQGTLLGQPHGREKAGRQGALPRRGPRAHGRTRWPSQARGMEGHCPSGLQASWSRPEALMGLGIEALCCRLSLWAVNARSLHLSLRKVTLSGITRFHKRQGDHRCRNRLRPKGHRQESDAASGSKGLRCGSGGEDSARNAGAPGLVPGSGRPPAEGKGCRLLGSNLGDPRDRPARRATVHRVT